MSEARTLDDVLAARPVDRRAVDEARREMWGEVRPPEEGNHAEGH